MEGEGIHIQTFFLNQNLFTLTALLYSGLNEASARSESTVFDRLLWKDFFGTRTRIQKFRPYVYLLLVITWKLS